MFILQGDKQLVVEQNSLLNSFAFFEIIGNFKTFS